MPAVSIRCGTSVATVFYLSLHFHRLNRLVPLVEQELRTLPYLLSSPSVLVGFMLLNLWFSVSQVVFCQPFCLFVHFFFFFFAIELSVIRYLRNFNFKVCPWVLTFLSFFGVCIFSLLQINLTKLQGFGNFLQAHCIVCCLTYLSALFQKVILLLPRREETGDKYMTLWRCPIFSMPSKWW